MQQLIVKNGYMDHLSLTTCIELIQLSKQLNFLEFTNSTTPGPNCQILKYNLASDEKQLRMISGFGSDKVGEYVFYRTYFHGTGRISMEKRYRLGTGNAA